MTDQLGWNCCLSFYECMRHLWKRCLIQADRLHLDPSAHEPNERLISTVLAVPPFYKGVQVVAKKTVSHYRWPYSSFSLLSSFPPPLSFPSLGNPLWNSMNFNNFNNYTNEPMDNSNDMNLNNNLLLSGKEAEHNKPFINCQIHVYQLYF